MPIDYLGAQISVPASYSVAYGVTASCSSTTDPGTVRVAPARGVFGCPLETAPPRPATTVTIEALAGAPALGPATSSQVRGISVRRQVAHPSGQQVEDVPSLGVRVTAAGPAAAAVLATLTRSPRAVALGPGTPARPPGDWRTIVTDGLALEVPASWPVRHTQLSNGLAVPCSALPAGVTLGEPGATISTDTANVLYHCPAMFPFRPTRVRVPVAGVQLDTGPLRPRLPKSTYAHCIARSGLRICVADEPSYSVLVLEVALPHRTTPIICSIGLDGTGLEARAIEGSLRAAGSF